MSECGSVCSVASPTLYRLVDFEVGLHFLAGNRARRQQADRWFQRILRPFQVTEASVHGGDEDFGVPSPDIAHRPARNEVLLRDGVTCSDAITVTRERSRLDFYYRLPPDGAGDLAYLTRAEEITLDYAVTRSSNKLWIHAACVVRRESLVFLVAPSGYGKTTLSLGLSDHGFLLATDDIVLFDVVEGCLIPCPRCPRIRGTALSQLAHAGIDLGAEAELTGRYVVLPRARFQLTPPPLRRNATHVFFLAKGQPSADESPTGLSLSRGIVEIARHSNLLAQDPELRLFESVFGDASFYRLQVGDYARNLREILAAVER